MFPKLLLLFILVPVAELYLFLTLGAKIGIWNTLGIIVLTAILGASLTRSQGARTLAKFRQATAEGRLPHREALDGILILLAGAVLLTPGFLTDTVGFLLLVPPIRTVVRGRLADYLKSRSSVLPPSRGPQVPPPASRENGDGIDG
jgi:UPF0716 protein FxsA